MPALMIFKCRCTINKVTYNIANHCIASHTDNKYQQIDEKEYFVYSAWEHALRWMVEPCRFHGKEALGLCRHFWINHAGLRGCICWIHRSVCRIGPHNSCTLVGKEKQIIECRRSSLPSHERSLPQILVRIAGMTSTIYRSSTDWLLGMAATIYETETANCVNEIVLSGVSYCFQNSLLSPNLLFVTAQELY